MSRCVEVLALERFTVRYPAFTVGPLDLEIRAGERVALVGPNGAGKSTTLRGVQGLLPRYEGSARVEGREVGLAGAAIRSRIGYAAERPSGFGWMTVGDHLSFLSSFYPTWDDARAEALAEGLGLPRGLRLAHLSKGTWAKLALVGAMAHAPALVLLDEATSGLDPVVRAQVLELVDTWAPRGGERTVLFSSHLLEDVERVADRLLILRDGRLVDDVTVEALRATAPGAPLSTVVLERLARA